MRRLLKIALLLNSILLLNSCAISKYNHLKCLNENTSSSIEPIIKKDIVYKYKASIDVLKNHLTGIIIVKQTDSITTHIVFVTELGMKMFDFEVTQNTTNAVYVFEPLNKPLFVEALKRNFSNMFMFNKSNFKTMECKNKNFSRVIKLKENAQTWFYSSKMEDKIINLQETFHNHKRNSKIEYIYDIGTKNYSQIKCKQYGLIKFYFELNSIPKTND